MDKELTEITPTNLDGTAVNTVKHASQEDVEAAAAAEKEQRQNYYVDPLEQDALMEKRRQELEEMKKRTGGQLENEEKPEEQKPEVDTSIRPDMNVNGFFSAGQTAKKPSFMNRSATKGFLSFGMIFGVINAIYSAFYLILLISGAFDIYWFLNWIYAVVAVISVIIVINGIRSKNSQKDDMKKKALIGIIGSAISAVPLFAWLIHLITMAF